MASHYHFSLYVFICLLEIFTVSSLSSSSPFSLELFVIFYQQAGAFVYHIYEAFVILVEYIFIHCILMSILFFTFKSIKSFSTFLKLIVIGVELIYNVVSFCCIAKGISYTYTHTLFVKLFSHVLIGHCREFSKVPCATQQVLLNYLGFLGGPVIKNLPASTGDTREVSQIPGLGRSLGVENDNPSQYSCLENSMNRGTR